MNDNGVVAVSSTTATTTITTRSDDDDISSRKSLINQDNSDIVDESLNKKKITTPTDFPIIDLGGSDAAPDDSESTESTVASMASSAATSMGMGINCPEGMPFCRKALRRVGKRSLARRERRAAKNKEMSDTMAMMQVQNLYSCYEKSFNEHFSEQR